MDESIYLPKKEIDPKRRENLCSCRPICGSRRRQWKGKLQKTSGELLIERKALAECFQRWPMKISPNSPCPLFARKGRMSIEYRNAIRPPSVVVRICQAQIDDLVETTYLKLAEMAKKIGAWDSVPARHTICPCGACCLCGRRQYIPRDAERAQQRRPDMREFDDRVKYTYQTMRIMYN